MKVKIKKDMAGNESEFKRVECKRINDKNVLLMKLIMY